MTARIPGISTLVLLFLSFPAATEAQIEYEREPINYSDSQSTDAVATLAKRLETGEAVLTWEPEHGYLKSILQQLGVSWSSQTLVFSKTSLQVSRITPETPRAVYFNDDVYVGWVQNGEVIELSAADPKLGGTFYTLPQKNDVPAKISRETSRCLQCHGTFHTRRTPGHMVRSVIPDNRGLPVFRLGTHLNDDTSPFAERWGGWYVTGTHGDQRHMGNSFLKNPEHDEKLDMESGANITNLSPLVDTSPYLTPHSDIVALMVLQHQATMHNILTAANHSGQLTMRDAEVMNKALDRPLDFVSESTERRYASAAEKVVRGLLFCDELRLTAGIHGTSSFAEEFQQKGPFDEQGRSLRQFDLNTRLFRYPCSFLIYSDAFREIPAGVRDRVGQRLQEILAGNDTSGEFDHLTKEDRDAIREILLSCPERLAVSI
ncbi:MAG: hypothetical protein R3C19_18510 [Planctomycetaceae bacterium]